MSAGTTNRRPDPPPPGPGRGREDVWRGLLGVAAVVLAIAGVVVGCSSDSGGGQGTPGRQATPPSAAAPGEPVPPLTAAPDKASAPAPLWEIAAGDPLSSFDNTPYNSEGAGQPTVAASPNIQGRQAIRFEVPGGGKRSELDPKTPVFKEGDDYWFGFAHYLPPEFPVNVNGWQVIAQWKNSGEGSPPIEVKVGNGQFQLDGGAGGEDPGKNYYSMPIGAARAGEQTDIVVHIVFSTDPGKATVDVWQNGQQRIRGFHPPGGTRYESDESYLKTGIYRDTAIPDDATLFLNDARVARSYASAAALASPTSSSR